MLTTTTTTKGEKGRRERRTKARVAKGEPDGKEVDGESPGLTRDSRKKGERERECAAARTSSDLSPLARECLRNDGGDCSEMKNPPELLLFRARCGANTMRAETRKLSGNVRFRDDGARHTDASERANERGTIVSLRGVRSSARLALNRYDDEDDGGGDCGSDGIRLRRERHARSH